MEEKVYYPAIFFSDIVEYYGGSEIYIEEQMFNNILETKSQKLMELKDSVEELQRIMVKKEFLESDRMGKGILNDLEKIKESDKEPKKIKKIEQIIKKVKSMYQIDSEIVDKILLKIQLLSEKSGNTGYSDTSILRLKDSRNNVLGEEKYNDIIDYLIEPETKDDYCDLGKRLLECICLPKYSGLPGDKLEQIKRYLSRPDFSRNHILRIFRILGQCSIGFTEIENNLLGERAELKTESEWDILEKITKALENIWGEVEVEGIGITQEEKSKISFEVGQDLFKDYKFCYKNTCNDIESSKGFQALIFYRLYNRIYYYLDDDMDNKDSVDMRHAMAFYAFSILQRAIEHTEILLHPAARIKSPTYIGDKVMVGKQCTIDAGCVLGNNVCLYPFNIYNREVQGQNRYILVGEKTVFCKNVKVIGSIDIGCKCVINKSIVVGNYIEEEMYVDKSKVEKINEKERLEKMSKVMEGIL